MNDNELLQAISKIIDDKLKLINERLDVIELKQDKAVSKIEDLEIEMKQLQLDVKISERNIRREIHLLKDFSIIHFNYLNVSLV